MRWKRIAGFGCLGVLVLAALAAGAMYYFFTQSVPPIAVDEPGAGGSRVANNTLPANWYPAAGEGPHPTLLFLGGSEGGLSERSNEVARRFQARGYNVLYQSYYRTSEDNEVFSLVPLETFDAALGWLAAQPEVDAERIGVVGGSKGAEGALLLASRDPRIRAVVAAMPSSVVWQGFTWTGFDMSGLSSSWSLGGKPLPYLPYADFEWGGTPGEMYAKSLAALAEHEDAVLAVERVNGPVLLVCGEADTLWPACDMARQVKARARDAGGPQVTLLAYEDAGHGVFGMPRAPDADNYAGLAGLGGTPDGNNAARKDSMAKLDAFLDGALKARE